MSFETESETELHMEKGKLQMINFMGIESVGDTLMVERATQSLTRRHLLRMEVPAEMPMCIEFGSFPKQEFYNPLKASNETL